MDAPDHMMGDDAVSFAFDVADTEVLPESEVVEGEEEETGVISQLMDIREPLLKLRLILEQKLDVDLSQYDFWLQDTQMLEESMTLVEQCVQGEGLVQINVELKVESSGVKKINIVDVLKPAEEPSEEEVSEDDTEPQVVRPERDTVTRWVLAWLRLLHLIFLLLLCLLLPLVLQVGGVLTVPERAGETEHPHGPRAVGPEPRAPLAPLGAQHLQVWLLLPGPLYPSLLGPPV